MTTKPPPEDNLKFWQAADEQEIGILIQVEPADQPRFINDLFECRKTFGGYENLMVFQPQPLGTVFIAKKTTELPA